MTESVTSAPPGAPPVGDMVWVPGGTFRMGSDDHYSEEEPARDVQVEGTWLARTAVNVWEWTSDWYVERRWDDVSTRA